MAATTVLGPQWRLSVEGLKLVTQNGAVTTKNEIQKQALNLDLKEIGSPILAEEVSKNRISEVVLQIQKIRNVAAPKANENSQAAPRMLKLVLTDGTSYAQAIETSPIGSISRDKTPPGAKVLLKNVRVVSGFLLINPNNCTLLGGKVPHLYEKWEVAKSIQTHNRAPTSTDGAPAWVNFGCKIQTIQELQIKSLDNKSKEASKEQTEFEQLRKGAIAEATSGAVRKVFGGGGVKAVQAPVSNVRNNRPVNNEVNANRDRNSKFAKVKNTFKDEDDKPQKPSERVSLFDFLENKLPISETTSNFSSATATNDYSAASNRPKPQSAPATNNRQNNYNKNKYNPNTGYQNTHNAHQNNYSNTNNFNSNYSNAGHHNSNQQSGYNHQQNNSYNQRHDYQPKRENKPPSSGYARSEESNYHGASQQRPYRNEQRGQNPKPVYAPGTNKNPQNYQSQQSKQSTQNATNTNNVQSYSNQSNGDQQVNNLGNNVAKMSLNGQNSQFASRTLRQHLNLGSSTKKDGSAANHLPANAPRWNVGDHCLAKYWEDGKFYNAIVTAVTEKTCVVNFTEYGNIEEVLRADCLPVNSNNRSADGNPNQDPNSRHYGGSLEFRRSTKSYNRK